MRRRIARSGFSICCCREYNLLYSWSTWYTNEKKASQWGFILFYHFNSVDIDLTSGFGILSVSLLNVYSTFWKFHLLWPIIYLAVPKMCYVGFGKIQFTLTKHCMRTEMYSHSHSAAFTMCKWSHKPCFVCKENCQVGKELCHTENGASYELTKLTHFLPYATEFCYILLNNPWSKTGLR